MRRFRKCNGQNVIASIDATDEERKQIDEWGNGESDRKGENATIKMTRKQGILWIEGKKGWRCKRLSLRRAEKKLESLERDVLGF